MYSNQELINFLEIQFSEMLKEECPTVNDKGEEVSGKPKTFFMSALYVEAPFSKKVLVDRIALVLNKSNPTDEESELLNIYDRIRNFLENRLATQGLLNKANSNIVSLALQSHYKWNERLEVSADASWADVLTAKTESE